MLQHAGAQDDHLLAREGEVQLAVGLLCDFGERRPGQHALVPHRVLLGRPFDILISINQVELNVNTFT